MLAKTHRLKRKKDLEKVFKEGKVFKEDFLILKVLKNNLGKARFSFIVSQKISKKAILRNKIKRRLSELVRLKLKKIREDIDVIIIALSGLEKKDFWETEEILNRAFLKAKIFKT
jgi:ribonuclease P protein component